MRARSGGSIDWVILSLYICLVGIGLMMIYTVGYGKDDYSHIDVFFDTPVGKQTIWISISVFAFLVIFLIDWKFWQTFANLIYLFSMFSLAAVLLLGKTIKGATSWFDFGGFTVQPSELAKFATCVALASYLSRYGTDLRHFKNQVPAIALFAAPMFLILLQPDAGSALVFLSFFILLFREGFPPAFFIVSFSVITLLLLGFVVEPLFVTLWLLVLGNSVNLVSFNKKRFWILIPLLAFSAYYWGINKGVFETMLYVNIGLLVLLSVIHWIKNKPRLAKIMLLSLPLGSGLVYLSNFAYNHFLEAHQQERIKVWLKPDECDPQGAAYNLVHSKMAIGSGGVYGKGFLKGNLTQGRFVPEQATDFIFCTVGEEQGFIGSVSIIAFYLLFLIRISILAERQRSDFSRRYAYGVAGILFIHVLINIGMTMGLVPIIGIPLPFISKGGSALVGFTIMIALLLKLDSKRYASY